MTSKITLIVVSFFIASTLFSQRTSWPMLNGDAAHTSQATINLSFPLQITDTIEVGYNAEDGMALYENYIFVQSASDSNILFAADIITGDSLWQFGIPGSGGSANYTPAAANGIVLASGQGADGVHALNVATGLEEWFIPSGSSYTRCPIISDGLAYIPSGGALWCLELETGIERWSFPGFIPQISPVANDSLLFFGSGGTVFALDKETGDTSWMQQVPNGTFSSYSLDDSRLYVNAYQTEINALDVTDGTVLWTMPIDTNERMVDYPGAFAQTEDHLVVKYFIDESSQNHYMVLEKTTGNLVNAFPGGSMFYGQHTIINDYILDYRNGTMLFLDIPSGDTAYQIDIPKFGTTPQVIAANDKIYVGSGGPDVLVLESDLSGTLDFLPELDIKIFPNPARDQVTIQLQLIKSEDIQVEIVSMDGEVVYRKEFGKLTDGKHVLDLETTKLSPAPYVVKVITNQGFGQSVLLKME